MIEYDIQFKCPQCGHDRLVEVRGDVEMRRLAFAVVKANGTGPGRKNSVLTGDIALSNGKIIGYDCEACGYRLKGVDKAYGRPNVVKSALNLFQWLKRNKMVKEHV